MPHLGLGVTAVVAVFRPPLPQRDLVEIQSRPEPGPRGGFARGAREAGATEVTVTGLGLEPRVASWRNVIFSGRRQRRRRGG